MSPTSFLGQETGIDGLISPDISPDPGEES